MHPYETTAENGSVESLDERDARALTQYLTVLDDIDRAAGAEDLYLVVSQSGESYLVDAREGACECPDHEYRDVRCKHLRRVAFATGERSIPGWVDRDGVDPDLGEHVDGEVRFAAADGGQAVPDEAERPDECACGIWNEDTGLPCWSCFRIGFESRNPDPPEADDE